MAENEGDSKDTVSGEFDVAAELSTLVEQQLLPAKIAERLLVKLNEKQVSITKEQLQMLVKKINEVMQSYSPGSTEETPSPTPVEKTDSPEVSEPASNMKELVDGIESLQQRIETIESNLADFMNFMGSDEGKEKSPNGKTPADSTQAPSKTYTGEEISTSGIFDDIDLEPLTTIPGDPESIVVLMKWLQFLIDKCGRIRLSDVLDYYVDIGWISDEAKIGLLDYSQGITEEAKRGDTARKNVSELPSKDHIQSLLFIQKLKGRKIDKHFLDRIQGELAKITKRLNNLPLQ
jgi:flagellar protein FlaD